MDNFTVDEEIPLRMSLHTWMELVLRCLRLEGERFSCMDHICNEVWSGPRKLI